MDGAVLQWLAGAGAAAGIGVGMLAFRWKRRSRVAWMIYGGVTFGAATLILAFLPRRERRDLSVQRHQNWHR